MVGKRDLGDDPASCGLSFGFDVCGPSRAVFCPSETFWKELMG